MATTRDGMINISGTFLEVKGNYPLAPSSLSEEEKKEWKPFNGKVHLPPWRIYEIFSLARDILSGKTIPENRRRIIYNLDGVMVEFYKPQETKIAGVLAYLLITDKYAKQRSRISFREPTLYHFIKEIKKNASYGVVLLDQEHVDVSPERIPQVHLVRHPDRVEITYPIRYTIPQNQVGKFEFALSKFMADPGGFKAVSYSQKRVESRDRTVSLWKSKSTEKLILTVAGFDIPLEDETFEKVRLIFTF
jgi:hypothetical protein